VEVAAGAGGRWSMRGKPGEAAAGRQGLGLRRGAVQALWPRPVHARRVLDVLPGESRGF
jgi:hypothetical protein